MAARADFVRIGVAASFQNSGSGMKQVVILLVFANYQIRIRIIATIAINMMNRMSSRDLTAERLFGNYAML